MQRPPGKPARLQRALAAVAGASVLILVWEAIARQSLPAILPGPVAVFRTCALVLPMALSLSLI